MPRLLAIVRKWLSAPDVMTALLTAAGACW